MDERQQLDISKEQLKSSMSNAWNDLKNYGKSVVNYASSVNTQRVLNFKSGVKQRTSNLKSKLGQVKNNMLSKLNMSNIDVKLKGIYDKFQLAGLSIVNKGVKGINIVKKQATDFTHSQVMKYEERKLNFKNNVNQKVTSLKSKLGQVKNDILSKLSISNIDVKLRNMYEQAQLAGLTIVNKGVQVVNTVKEQVTDFAYTQMANHYIRQEEENAKIQEREKIVKAEMQKEAEINSRTEEHKQGMKEALREKDRMEIQGRILNFKSGVKQRASSLKSKLGQVKNDILSKLSISNIDVKLRNVYEKAQLAGLSIVNKSVQVVNNIKEQVTDFAYTQMANHYLKQEERRIQKEFALAAKKAEQEEIQKMKEQIKARKNDMIAALNSEERELYEEKHIENQTRKQELLNSLGMESQKLFGVDENFYEEPKKARAM